MHPDQRRERPFRARHSLRRISDRGLRRHLTVGVIAVAGVLQVLGGVALATTPTQTPAPGPTYQPTDLVAVAHDGVQGYCYWGELEGPPQALWEGHYRIMQYTGNRGYGIPMYAADGVTRIGHFEIGGPGSGGGGSSPDGSRREQTADGHGTIIETKRSATGLITITRTWLSGASTTTTAATDPSLTRIPRSERPVTWRAITLWFRGTGPKHPELTSTRPKAPAWLVDRMSAAARAAGDPDATARWTLTYRRCAAPLEGASTPSSDKGKYKVVWIALLHGDFTGGTWMYLVLDRGSHDVIAHGTSATLFDRSMFRLQGWTQLR